MGVPQRVLPPLLRQQIAAHPLLVASPATLACDALIVMMLE